MKSHPEATLPRPARTPWRWVLATAASITVVLLAARLVEMQLRLERVETEREGTALGLYTRILGVQEEITGIRDDLQVTTDRAELTSALSERLRTAEVRLGSIGQTIEAQSTSLSTLESERAAFVPELEQRLDEREQRLLSRWESLTQLVSTTREIAGQSVQRIEELDEALAPRDLQRMWSELVGPVVQLAGASSVGSGVLLLSEEQPEDGFKTPLITAWHVVRDIQGDLTKTDMPVPVSIYAEDGSIRHEEAQLICFDAQLDAALLEITTADSLENGARLASRDRLDQVRIFDRVYAVGCPLGNDPIPTYGEVATASHEIEGENYWMINAPTYIGNSGGGIFDSKTHELLGIFSKIYTHGTLRPTIVPHMGLVTPMSAIYDWLEGAGHPMVSSRKAVAAAH